MRFSRLFEPLKLGGITVKNRFAVSPMSMRLAEPDGTVNQRTIDYYTERAKGGFGLIYTEYTTVKADRGRACANQLGIYEDRMIPGLRKLTDSIHENGSNIFVQLHHAGGRGDPSANTDGCIESVVAVNDPGIPVLPTALTTEDCYRIVDYYAEAARRAREAGFDGVDIHCGHGYLLSGFLSPSMNKRTDEFGGDVGSRAKLPVLIIRRIRKEQGEDFPITCRINGSEWTVDGIEPREAGIIAELFEEAGCSAINMTVGGSVTQHYALKPATFRPGSNNEFSEAIKRHVSIPVFSVGKLTDPYFMVEMLETGAADMAVLGRASIADPYFPNKVKEGRLDDISPCIGCNQSCVGYLGRPEGGSSCLVNPFSGREGEWKLTKTDQPKRVVVVGAGPAGMMAAWTAARIGHQVTLLEKSSDTGGQFRLAGIAPGKFDINRMIKFYTKMCRDSGVDLRLNTEASGEQILALCPDAVILATGAVPLRPRIEGIDGERICQANDVLKGKVLIGGRALICGGGLVGSELAEFLQDRYVKPVIIDMLPVLAKDMDALNRQHMIHRLETGVPGAENGLQTILGAKILRFLPDGVEYELGGELQTASGFDHIILAMGSRAYNPLEQELSGKVKELQVIGDAVKPGMANVAIEAAVKAAMRI